MTAPQFSSWFWPLIGCLGGDTAAIAQRFQTMPSERLLDFGREYERARACIRPYHRPGGELSDYRDDLDGAGDVFAAWVVSRGEEFWDRVRRDPEAFRPATDEFDQAADAFMGRRADRIAASVFRDRFGEEMFFALRRPNG